MRKMTAKAPCGEISRREILSKEVYDCVKRGLCICAIMMMIAFITVRSSLVPLIEGLCAQIFFRFEISVVCVHIFCFSFSEEKIC